MKHTPGPWSIEKPFQETHTYITEPDMGLIACIKDHYGNPKANAHLIAAAPDLLEWVKRARGLTFSDDTYIQADIEREIDTLIAKAEGRAT